MEKRWVLVILAVAIGASVLVFVPSARKAAAEILTQVFFDPDPPPPWAIDVIVDLSKGSTVTPERLRTQIEVVLQRTGMSPGGAVRIVVQGAKAMAAVIVASVLSEKPKQPRESARKAYAKQFAAAQGDFLMKAMEPFFEDRPLLQRSPIAETTNWVAMLSLPPGVSPGTLRRIIFITDAREVSEFGDFECVALPTPADFLKKLRAQDVLTPGSLEGVRLHFAFVEPKPVARRKCLPMTVARIRGIQALWTVAAQNAGATEVTFDTGVKSFPITNKENES